MDFDPCFKLNYNFWTKFVKINFSPISKFSGHSGSNPLARQSYLQPTSLQTFTDKGRKMSSDQADIKFEDADLYEKFMGVWSRMLGSKFIDWISPDQGKKILVEEWCCAMVFCFKSCSDLLWEKIVPVIETNFWNLRLKAKLYTPSTLNMNLILWHTHLIVCAVK